MSTVTVTETINEVTVSHEAVAVTATAQETPVTVAAGVTDHGALTGLSDDDHAQYLNTARHAAIGSNPHGVTASDVGALPLTGGTMTGALVLDGDPAQALEAATKQYVDNNAGGASDVGDLTTTTGNAGEMVRVASGGGLEYRTTAQVLADIGAAAADDLADYLPLTGGTLTGSLGIGAMPASELHIKADGAAIKIEAETPNLDESGGIHLLETPNAGIKLFYNASFSNNGRLVISDFGSGLIIASFARDGTVTYPNTTSLAIGGIGSYTISAATAYSSAWDGSSEVSQLGSDALYLYNNNPTAAYTGLLFRAREIFGSTGKISLVHRANAQGDFAFSLRDGSFLAEKMRLTALGNLGIGITEPVTRMHAVKADAITAAITDIASLGHNSTGTPAAGFGAGLLYQLQSSTTENRNAARIAALWQTATDASRKADLVLSAFDTAEREGLRIRATGSAALLITSLPTSDPGVSGALWNDSGTVKVST